MIVYSGTSTTALGRRVAEGLGAVFADVEARRFPDGETYLRSRSTAEGEDCLVVSSTPGNDDLVELVLLLDLLRDLGASRVDAVVPYIGYSRQDRRFMAGEALSAKTVLKLVSGLSDSVTSVNCHFLDGEGVYEFHGMKVKNLDAFPLLAEYFAGKLEKPVVIAPDRGSLDYARNAAKLMGCEFDFLRKKRLSGDEVVVEVKDLDVGGRDVLILDDMISTGGTVIEAAKVLRDQDAASVNVGCVHGVFSHGMEKVAACVDMLACTDTLERGISEVSVSGLVADAFRRHPRTIP